MNFEMNAAAMLRWLKTLVWGVGKVKYHFSQYSEDALIRKLFPRKKLSGTYLDLGAYHPFKFSNTAFFWLKGWRGINVDANAKTIALFNKVRSHDKNIHTAMISQAKYLAGARDIAYMSPKDKSHDGGLANMGTCDTELAGERDYSRATRVPAISVVQLLKDLDLKELDYLNVDIEGFDETIISDFDFSVLKPIVISIENYATDVKQVLESAISETLFNQGYQLKYIVGVTSIYQLSAESS